jgi:hypothetical protein
VPNLTSSDESAMNLEAVGGFLDIFYFPQHIYVLGVPFAESMWLPRQSRPNKLHRAGHMSLAYEEAILRA